VHAELKQTLPDLREVHQGIGVTAAEFRAQYEVLNEAQAEVRSALAEQLESVQAQVARLDDFWSDLEGQFEGLASGLESSIHELRAVAVERLREVFQQFDSEMAKVVKHLSGTLAELREVSVDLPTQVGELRVALTGIQQSAAGYEEPLSRIAASLDATRTSADRVATLDARAKELVKALNSVQATVASSNGMGRRAASRGEAEATGGTGPMADGRSPNPGTSGPDSPAT
jgi:prefoldin subunit 5